MWLHIPRISIRRVLFLACAPAFALASLLGCGAAVAAGPIPDFAAQIPACNKAYEAMSAPAPCVVTQVHVDKSIANSHCFGYPCEGGPGTWTQVAAGTAPGRYLYNWHFAPDDPAAPPPGLDMRVSERIQAAIDWKDAGAQPLNFTRYHRSYGSLAAGVGEVWSHNYAATVSTGVLARVVRLGDGTRSVFRRPSANSPWKSENGKDQLLESPSGTVFVRASDESRWQFSGADAVLTSITQANGLRMTLTYGNGRLVRVTNAFGRSLQLDYNEQGRLARLTPTGSEPIRYRYDAASRLVAVNYPDHTVRTYVYADPSRYAALMGVTDEGGIRLASFTRAR